MSFLSFVLAFVLARFFYPIIASLLRDTALFGALQDRISNALGFGGTTAYMLNIQAQTASTGRDLQSVLDGIALPSFIQERLISGDTAETRSLLGAGTADEFVSAFLAGAVINVIAMIIAFMLAFVALRIATHMINIATRLPIINQVNKLFGAAFGAMIGLFTAWALLTVVVWGFGNNPANEIYAHLENSLFADRLLEINVIARVVGMF